MMTMVQRTSFLFSSWFHTCLFFLSIGICICMPACGGGKIDSISNADPEKIRSAAKVVVEAGDWPWWSGPNRNFESSEKNIPVSFGEDENCSWKYSFPGEGHASPIVVSGNVFIAIANLESKTKSLLCLDRETGKKKWDCELHKGRFMHTHGKNSQASSTPASDGQRVFTAFMFDNGIQVSAVDFNGKVLWQKSAGSFSSRHGYGSSPIIYRSLVIVAGDNPGSGFITAFDRESGEIVWRINRANESSYATPSIVKLNGSEQLLISGASKVHAYDPVTGDTLWSTQGPAQTTANTLASDGKLIFAGGGYPEKRFYCIDAESRSIVWQTNLKSYVPSPVLAGKQVVIPQDGGIVSSFAKENGELTWKIRLGQDVSGSGVLVRNHLYIGGENGTLFVIDLNDSGKIVSKNRLDSRIMSTPAICGNQLFVRTAQTLYCFTNSLIEKSN